LQWLGLGLVVAGVGSGERWEWRPGIVYFVSVPNLAAAKE